VEISVIAVPVAGEVKPGADLPGLIDTAVRSAGVTLRDGDVVVVTQKVVSKAEGRIVPAGPDGRAPWVAAEARRIVARRGDLVIAETRHGFVCANAGVDASNVAEGFLTLLPEDPDASAEEIRVAFRAGMGVDVGVIITDTFGRPWRQGLVNVAIGCAGLPAVVDLRGTKDASGRVLEATVEALADEVAAATGLVMGKAEGVPIAVVRGVHAPGPPSKASALVRRGAEDLFRESPLQAIHARRSIRRFGRAEVPGESLREAVAAACTAPAPHHTRPWLFVALRPGPLRRRLLAAMRQAWAADLRGDGTDPTVIERRLRASDELLGEAPVIIVPFVRLRGSHAYPDEDRAAAEREMFLLSGGAAIQSLMLALHAQGLASCWVSSTLFCKEETREALGLADEWIPLGSVAVGSPPDGGEPAPRPPLDVGEFLRDGS
jgi:dehydro coenzyme F420 reductase / coenzyme F420-0:L-glutamate ligase / coenzyme F420-1:gamma-L-glutamate ligase